MLVTSDMKTDLEAILQDYDLRGGVPENSFCQSNQGLALRRRRKRGFVAQQMLTLLSQLAHNLILWLKGWMTDSLSRQMPTQIDADSHLLSQPLKLAIRTIKGFGIKRFVRQILGLGGRVLLKGHQVKRLVLHPAYPLIDRITAALDSLLKPYRIHVGVGKS